VATVYRKTFTKPLPSGAETFTRKGEKFARWKDAKGKTRTANVTTGKDGSERLLIEAKTFTAKYRDGSGIVREVATGCRDETAARAVLAELVKRCEHVKSGLMTAAQDAVIDHQGTPLGEHVAAWLDYLTGKGVTVKRRDGNESYLRRLMDVCGFSRLADSNRSTVEKHLARLAADGTSAAVRNGFRSAAIAFCNWCVVTRRLVTNPLDGIPKANEKADPRRHRRALREDELRKLLAVVLRRPLLDTMTVHRGKHKGEVTAKLRDETKARLMRLGRERALIYKTLVLTGLRKGELASITVGQLDLDGPRPCLLLHAADEKNRQGSCIQLRSDLAADLRQWIDDKRTWPRNESGTSDGPLPLKLSADTPLFTVPAGLVRILDHDLKAAGIAKRDDRGWTVDVRALRHSFGTLLSKGGVAPRTAQAAMRHSSIDLTMNVYTDPQLLDVAGTVEALPDLPLETDGKIGQEKATGTDGPTPPLAPTSDISCKSVASPDKTAGKANSDKHRNMADKPQLSRQKRGGRYWTRTSDLLLVREAL
jgi:integrase